ncbi:probable E3 ubiquitin-protein ligase makorin-1 [Mizuhopecten yessoensis]|uniref:RING-type E3 ubiquitin transferase n=1 Tax=Mizuhopecten yessoensis TaxID=6573 RepID=A0A210QR92_MIZYE|nr:probable E3 ubiquitin-protein ligase makorin-1 [Mizuhopecten yessoensis]OWF51252.1 E3 ubiquitin-protein ligase makorin-1 [Mizuhopecten yessoensis]
MAEGGKSTAISPGWSSSTLCRYFVHGACREGEKCSYSHDRQDKPSNVCRFYLKGSCTYGNGCRYDHVKPKSNYHENTWMPPSNKPPPLNYGETKPFGNMVSLKKSKEDVEIVTVVSPRPPDEWVKATEFVPGQPYQCSTVPFSYSNAVDTNRDGPKALIIQEGMDPYADLSKLVCPFFAQGHCPYEEDCAYIHGDICEMCGMPVLHPSDLDQREKHNSECMKQLEQDMELSFAIAQSKDKVCGICMDTILDKEPMTERRFGIMSNCNHTFCLSCIRKWRGARQFENKIVRACPECRVTSDFVTPSKYWVESDEEKKKLIQGYKKALSAKPCMYFKKGEGECPFNEKCFYLHANEDGTIATPKPRQRRRRQNAEGDIDLISQMSLWDFFEERQNRVLLLELESELDNLLLNLRLSDIDSDSDFDDFW